MTLPSYQWHWLTLTFYLLSYHKVSLCSPAQAFCSAACHWFGVVACKIHSVRMSFALPLCCTRPVVLLVGLMVFITRAEKLEGAQHGSMTGHLSCFTYTWLAGCVCYLEGWSESNDKICILSSCFHCRVLWKLSDPEWKNHKSWDFTRDHQEYLSDFTCQVLRWIWPSVTETSVSTRDVYLQTLETSFAPFTHHMLMNNVTVLWSNS